MADLRGAVFTSRGRTITEADIVNFAGVSGDFAPIHVDREFARGTPYGAPVAHGLLTLAVATTLATAARPFSALASYGYDRLRFPAAVAAGDTISVRVTVGGARPRGPTGERVLDLDYEVRNQRGEVVLACTHQVVVERSVVEEM